MKKILLGLFVFGLTAPIFSQTVELPETLISVNYNYLDATDLENVPNNVKKLEESVLNYKNTEIADLYNDEYETYKVSFYIPEGKIVAAYDNTGKIIRTIEKYNNVRLPLEVMQAIAKRFPNWAIIEDVYFIKYQHDQDSVTKEYKVKIQNNDKTITVKTDEIGTFL